MSQVPLAWQRRVPLVPQLFAQLSIRPGQHGWPLPPQATQLPPMLAVPAGQLLPQLLPSQGNGAHDREAPRWQLPFTQLSAARAVPPEQLAPALQP